MTNSARDRYSSQLCSFIQNVLWHAKHTLSLSLNSKREEIIHTLSEVFCTMHFMFAVEKRLSSLCCDVSFCLQDLVVNAFG